MPDCSRPTPPKLASCVLSVHFPVQVAQVVKNAPAARLTQILIRPRCVPRVCQGGTPCQDLLCAESAPAAEQTSIELLPRCAWPAQRGDSPRLGRYNARRVQLEKLTPIATQRPAVLAAKQGVTQLLAQYHVTAVPEGHTMTITMPPPFVCQPYVLPSAQC
jgi:hypothetical protein